MPVKKKLTPKLTFTSAALPLILEALKKKTDKAGFVIDSKNNYVLDVDGKKFKMKAVMGVVGNNWITNIYQIDRISLN